MTTGATQIERAATAVKDWRFAEQYWYCGDCGFVSGSDVQKVEKTDETGTCRCGQEISKTTF